MSEPLPGAVPLTGTDWFLLGIDKSMRRRTGAGCVCHLVVRLAAPLQASELRPGPWMAWLGRLRARGTPPVQVPRWEDVGQPAAVVEVAADDADALVAQLPGRLDPAAESAVRLTTATLADGTGALALSFHHALLDARTAEALLRGLGGDPAETPAFLPAPSVALGERLRIARTARDFVWRVSTGNIAGPGRWGQAGRTRHRHVVLEEADVARLRARATSMGVGLIPSTLHAAACSWAVSRMLAARGQRGDLLVPMPQDRRAGTASPVGNGISLLFFRVPASAQGDVEGLARLALDQVRTMARDKVPTAMATLLDMCRRLPSWAYMPVVAVPTGGRLASFGFSDTGDSLSKLDRVAGVEVLDAWHLPANMHPPGLTFVFSGFRGRLQICVAWAEDVVRDDEIDALVVDVLQALLGDAG